MRFWVSVLLEDLQQTPNQEKQTIRSERIDETCNISGDGTATVQPAFLIDVGGGRRGYKQSRC